MLHGVSRGPELAQDGIAFDCQVKDNVSVMSIPPPIGEVATWPADPSHPLAANEYPEALACSANEVPEDEEAILAQEQTYDPEPEEMSIFVASETDVNSLTCTVSGLTSEIREHRALLADAKAQLLAIIADFDPSRKEATLA